MTTIVWVFMVEEVGWATCTEIIFIHGPFTAFRLGFIHLRVSP